MIRILRLSHLFIYELLTNYLLFLYSFSCICTLGTGYDELLVLKENVTRLNILDHI